MWVKDEINKDINMTEIIRQKGKKKERQKRGKEGRKERQKRRKEERKKGEREEKERSKDLKREEKQRKREGRHEFLCSILNIFSSFLFQED